MEDLSIAKVVIATFIVRNFIEFYQIFTNLEDLIIAYKLLVEDLVIEIFFS